MLHPIKEPALYSPMMQVVEVQIKLVRLAADIAINGPYTDNTFVQAFGQEVGDWFWRRYSLLGKQGQHSELRKALDALRTYCNNNAAASQQLVDAIVTDADFHNHLTDDAFELQFSKLGIDLQNVAKRLLVNFYTVLGGSGFPKELTGLNIQATRTRYVGSYCSANPDFHVCPVCDRDEPDDKDGVPAFQLDHYLPKSLYPILSVHPRNLLPTCAECNTVFKGETDPLENNPNGDVPAAVFLNAFHPFDTPLLSVANVSVKSVAGSLKIEITDRNGMPSRRVDRAAKVYLIPSRWEKRLRKTVVDDVMEDLKRQGRSRKRSLSIDDAREYLTLLVQDTTNSIGKRGNSLLKDRYIRFILDTPAEMSILHQKCFP